MFMRDDSFVTYSQDLSTLHLSGIESKDALYALEGLAYCATQTAGILKSADLCSQAKLD